MTARRPQISKPALRRLAHPAAALEARGLVRYVAVHHKAGIVWMNRFFRTLGWRIGVPVIKLGQAPVPGREQTLTADGRRTVPEERVEAAVAMVSGLRRGFAFDHAGAFAEVPYQLERLRGVHVVRDPRDVLISATFYHASNRRETWLQWERADLGGMSYQEKLNSLPTLRERYEFELANLTGWVIREMAGFPDLPNVTRTRYESLMSGDVLGAFETMFSALELPGRVRRVALECAREESIILNPSRRDGHVRSGEPEQWRRRFDRRLGEHFAAEVGEELIALGYESDASWLADLPDHLPELDRAGSF